MNAVELLNVSKSYGNAVVLDDVSFDVRKGTAVALIGRSGSGKSTLLRCVNGLEPIQGGAIRVGGFTLGQGSVDLRKLRQKVGIVFQSYNLFPQYTALRNITLALTVVKKMRRADADAIGLRVLDRVGLLHRKDAYAHELSGGQQQRVAIARMLAMSPEVMLFDEVTSALDPELKEDVLKVMAELAADGMTMIVVTHEMRFARNVAHEIIFMHQGKVWERGAPETCFGQPSTPELKQFVSFTH